MFLSKSFLQNQHYRTHVTLIIAMAFLAAKYVYNNNNVSFELNPTLPSTCHMKIGKVLVLKALLTPLYNEGDDVYLLCMYLLNFYALQDSEHLHFTLYSVMTLP